MARRRTDYGEIWPHVRSAVEAGRRVAETRNALRAGGLSFSNQVFSRLWRVESQVQSLAGDEADMPLERKPGGNRIARFPGARFATKYIQRARLIFIDRSSGAVRDFLYQTGENKLLTRGEVLTKARDNLTPVAESLDLLLVTATYHSTLARA